VVSAEARRAGPKRLFVRLGPARGRLAEVVRMERIATAIAVRSLARNGLLLHAALAVRDGAGFILAGPSGAGKSTASRRLPLPWQSLSDDCVLVVRAKDGQYWAHPWPTWSLLRDNGPVKSWPVEPAVPLKALLFLRQSASDRAEPVAITPATALIMESSYQLARVVAFTPEARANRVICAKYLRAAWALAAAKPAFRLSVSLAGRFWDEIERAVRTAKDAKTAKTEPESTTKAQRHEESSGSSLTPSPRSPTPDFETAKDAKTAKFRKELSTDSADDTVYGLRSTEHGQRTADDRNCRPERVRRDEGSLRPTADRRRCGLRIEQNSDTRKQNAELRKDGAEAEQGKATHPRRRRSVPGPPRRLLSGSPQPRLVRFQAGQRTFLKLVRGRRVVASASDLLGKWYIQRPPRASAGNRRRTAKPPRTPSGRRRSITTKAPRHKGRDGQTETTLSGRPARRSVRKRAAGRKP
jgi:hypothetical protein